MVDTGARDDVRNAALDDEHREIVALIVLAWLLVVVAALSAVLGLGVVGPSHQPAAALTIAGFTLVGGATSAVCACVRSTGLRIREQIR